MLTVFSYSKSLLRIKIDFKVHNLALSLNNVSEMGPDEPWSSRVFAANSVVSR